MAKICAQIKCAQPVCAQIRRYCAQMDCAQILGGSEVYWICAQIFVHTFFFFKNMPKSLSNILLSK